MKALLELRDVAVILDCSLRQVQRLLASGELCGSVAGRRRIVKREDLTAFMQKREALHPAETAQQTENLPQAAPVSSSGPGPEDTPEPCASSEEVDPNDIETWATERLEAARLIWMKPDRPGGPITNQPAVGSGTQPSPENFAKLIRANAILLARRFSNMASSATPHPSRRIIFYR
jgi:hypothetical protein